MMRPSMSALLSLLFAGSLLYTTTASSGVISIHGSGTSNPARCYGSVMEELQARSKLPLRLTYRSVGSSIGLEEFINDRNPLQSASDFGSGEIPLASEDWQAFRDENVTVLQIPTLFGAVSFFHSVPGMPNLNLTSCLLARIFTRDIKDWAHPDIREINPGLTKLFEQEENANSLGASLRIRVATREEGSSNTNAITQYLNKACPQHFPAEMVGPLPTWPLDTEACRGILGMNDCIQERAGTIGYNEAGIGQFAGLQEISIKNKYGRLLTSQQAAANGGIGAKEMGILPEDPRDDFSDVSLLDQEGEFTWPITLLTYVYVRSDTSFKTDAVERALLGAFVKALFDPSFVSPCQSKYGFFLADGPALKLAHQAIDILESGLDTSQPTWTFETKAEAIVGSGEYVLSANRRNYPAIERETNNQDVDDLKELVAELQRQVLFLTTELDEGNYGNENGNEAEFTSKYESMIVAGVVMGALSLVLALGLAVLFVVRAPQAGDK